MEEYIRKPVVSLAADPQDALRCLHVSRDEACLTVSFSRPLLVSLAPFTGEHRRLGAWCCWSDGSLICPLCQVGPSTETLLLMVNESPLSVEWRTPDGRNRPSHVWVSQEWWGRVGGAGAGLG